jgi:NADPH:quinone reductase-like Zn-dependent oxidoreductase
MKFLGFTRIVVYASKVHFEYLKELGATECIDRGEVPIEALVVSPPVKVVYDTAGALDAAYDSVVDGGKVTTVNPRAKTEREGRGVTLVHCFGFYVGPEIIPPIGDPAHWSAVAEHTTFGKLLIKELPKMLEKGVIVVCVFIFIYAAAWLTSSSQTELKFCPKGWLGSRTRWRG